MSDERRLWKCQLLAEEARNLSRSMAMQAAMRDSRAYAVVAGETLRLAESMLCLVERLRFDDIGESVFESRASEESDRLEMLSLNASIVALELPSDKAMAICADEARRIAIEFAEASCRRSRADALLTPLPSMPIATARSEEYFVAFPIGGLRFVENLRFVREVMRYDAKALGLEGGTMDLRGRRIPFIDGLPRQRTGGDAPANEAPRRVIVVNADWREGERREYGVAVDGLPIDAIFRSRIGLAVEARGPEAEHVREAWDAVDGSQLRFLDWPRLAGR